MLILLALLSRFITPSHELNIEQMADLRAHAEATLRLRAGIVEQSSMTLAKPTWSFLEMRKQPELDAELAVIGTQVSPFATDEDTGPFVEAGR
jgi:hypothetical protein